MLGQNDRGLADIDQSIKQEPNYAYAFVTRGSIYRQQGKFDLALADFDQAIKLRPGFAEAFLYRGEVYDDLDQLLSAIEDFNRAIALVPDFTEAYFGRGNSYARLGQYAKALQDMNQIIKLKPDESRLLERPLLDECHLGATARRRACRLQQGHPASRQFRAVFGLAQVCVFSHGPASPTR